MAIVVLLSPSAASAFTPSALARAVGLRPVILDGKQIDAWLDGSAGTEILTPAKESALKEWPVSKRVNKVGNDDDPTLIEKEAA